MVEVPVSKPDTIPDDDPIVATDEVLLVQVPPPASLNVVDELTQTMPEPEIAEGRGLTVSVTDAVQPVGSV